MALIKCSNCSEYYSDLLSVCKYCNNRKELTKNNIKNSAQETDTNYTERGYPKEAQNIMENQLIDIFEDELLIKDSSNEERRIPINKIADVNYDSITSSVNCPINRYKVIRNLLLIILLLFAAWNYNSNYKEIEIKNTAGYGGYGKGWLGSSYQPGGPGSSVYRTYEKRDGDNWGVYYNKRIAFYAWLFAGGAVLICGIILLHRPISEYKYQYKYNLHTIKIRADDGTIMGGQIKVIYVGNYEETKEAYETLIKYKKESMFV